MNRTVAVCALLGLALLPVLGACANQAPRAPQVAPPAPPAPAPAPTPRTWQPAPAPLPVSTQAFPHQNLPLEQVLAEVGRTQRPGLLYFCAGWCGFCTKLNRLTLSRPDVQQAIRGEFTAVEYDVDTPVGRQVANRYDAHGFPTMVVVNAQGEVTKTIVGYRDGPALLGVLRAP